jgi:hypothetical protein
VAFPLIAGPGVLGITPVLVAQYGIGITLTAFIINLFIFYAVLKFSISKDWLTQNSKENLLQENLARWISKIITVGILVYLSYSGIKDLGLLKLDFSTTIALASILAAGLVSITLITYYRRRRQRLTANQERVHFEDDSKNDGGKSEPMNKGINVLQQLIQRRLKEQGLKPLVLLIDGDAGVGKTFFTDRIVSKKEEVVVFHADDYMRMSQDLFFVKHDWDFISWLINNEVRKHSARLIILEGYKVLDVLQAGLVPHTKVKITADDSTRRQNIDLNSDNCGSMINKLTTPDRAYDLVLDNSVEHRLDPDIKIDLLTASNTNLKANKTRNDGGSLKRVYLFIRPFYIYDIYELVGQVEMDNILTKWKNFLDFISQDSQAVLIYLPYIIGSAYSSSTNEDIKALAKKIKVYDDIFVFFKDFSRQDAGDLELYSCGIIFGGCVKGITNTCKRTLNLPGESVYIIYDLCIGWFGHGLPHILDANDYNLAEKEAQEKGLNLISFEDFRKKIIAEIKNTERDGGNSMATGKLSHLAFGIDSPAIDNTAMVYKRPKKSSTGMIKPRKETEIKDPKQKDESRQTADDMELVLKAMEELDSSMVKNAQNLFKAHLLLATNI